MINFLLAQAAPQPPPQPLPHPELPEVFLPPAPLPLWIFIVGVLILVSAFSLVIWLLMRPGKATPPPLKKPWQTAMNALKNLATTARSQAPGQTSAQVSEILRRYFMDRYKIPAPFRTSREIFEGDSIPANALRLHKYAALADLWDQLSFAPEPASTEESLELIAKAITHLEEDRP